tara:strand:- start:98263 stop:98625 length:363 start_codon:yes stop_codon:yes gene_type:complete
MNSLDPLKLAGAKAKGKRPYFLENPDVERLTNIVLVLTQELAVTRERMDTIERLLERGEPVSKAAIDSFRASRTEADERGQWTQEYLARVFRIIQQEGEAIEKVDEAASEDVANELPERA